MTHLAYSGLQLPVVSSFRASQSSSIYPEHPLDTVGIYKRNDDGHWKTSEIAIDKLTPENIKGPCIIFASTSAFKPPRPGKEEIYRARRQSLSQNWGLPLTYWSHTTHKASGFFGCADHCDGEGKIVGHNTWLRFLIKQPANNPLKNYIWQKIKIFTHWRAETGGVVFCFDPPSPFRERLQDAVGQTLSAGECIADPYFIITVIIEEVIALFNQSVWSFRDMVRHAEKNRKWSSHPEPPFSELHDVARHVIHSSETLAIAGLAMHSISNQHASFVQNYTSATNKPALRKVQQTLEYQQTLFQSLKLRSDALGDRLRNEINLVFNMVAQSNSLSTIAISKAAQSDSRAMRTIAILTLLFLPGTFISTLLAMPFFSVLTDSETGAERWSVSNKFWIYWAITAPITIITVSSWLVWQFWESKFMKPSGSGGDKS